jgi:hypothetical protein
MDYRPPGKEMHEIFVSYRRSDAQGHAGRLRDRLIAEFGEDTIFYDQHSTNPGELWAERIDLAVREARILLAVIARDWLDTKDQAGLRRLDEPGDVVRRELTLAFELQKTVIPILIDDARTPPSECLPEGLRGLGGPIQHLVLSSQQTRYDVAVRDLIGLIRKELRLTIPRPCPDDPNMLPYLCDRSQQEEALRDLLEDHVKHTSHRPLVCVIPGGAREAHGAFVDRLEYRSLPRRLAALSLSGPLRFLRLKRPMQLNVATDFESRFRSQLADELQVAAFESQMALFKCFCESRLRLIAPVLTVRSREDMRAGETYFDMTRDFWSEFPDLPTGLLLISLVCVKFESADQLTIGSLVKPILRWAESRKIVRINQIIRERILRFSESAGRSAKVVCRVLPELISPTVNDVEEWATYVEVAAKLGKRHLSERRLQEIFGGKLALPMDDLIDRLSDLLTAGATLTKNAEQ